jgi:hypothetical protein
MDPDEYRNHTMLKAFATVFLVALLFMCIFFFVLSCGCVTASKNIYKDITATPEPTPTPPPPTPEPTPTPTPEPTLSQAQYMEKFGGLNQGEWLSWSRDNVSGLKDMTVHTTVYGFREFGVVNWHSVSWGQYFIEGAGEGKKFLFIFVHTYTDEGSARVWGFNRSHYYLDINGTLYPPSDRLLPEIRIKEFDEIWNLNHVENIKPYGYLRRYNSEGKEVVEELGFIKSGKSNAWDGYIVYEIPKDTKPEEIKVLSQFHNFIDPHWWQLTEPKY